MRPFSSRGRGGSMLQQRQTGKTNLPRDPRRLSEKTRGSGVFILARLVTQQLRGRRALSPAALAPPQPAAASQAAAQVVQNGRRNAAGRPSAIRAETANFGRAVAACSPARQSSRTGQRRKLCLAAALLGCCCALDVSRLSRRAGVRSIPRSRHRVLFIHACQGRYTNSPLPLAAGPEAANK